MKSVEPHHPHHQIQAVDPTGRKGFSLMFPRNQQHFHDQTPLHRERPAIFPPSLKRENKDHDGRLPSSVGSSKRHQADVLKPHEYSASILSQMKRAQTQLQNATMMKQEVPLTNCLPARLENKGSHQERLELYGDIKRIGVGYMRQQKVEEEHGKNPQKQHARFCHLRLL